MGRGTSKVGRGGGTAQGNPYLQDYLENNPWLANMPEESRKAIIDNFANNMSEAEQFYYSLTDAEKSAIVDMQQSTRMLNEYMSGRSDVEPQYKKQFDATIANTKSAIDKYQLNKPVTLYRGVGEKEFNSIAEGGKTESFKSTSVDPSRAEAFARNQGGYIIEYKVSKGSRVANVNGAPGANEGEYLIDSNVKYKKVKKSGNKITINI